MHAEAPAADVYPTAHVEHAQEPSVEYEPAGHGAITPLTHDEPAGHVVHAEEFAGEYVEPFGSATNRLCEYEYPPTALHPLLTYQYWLLQPEPDRPLVGEAQFARLPRKPLATIVQTQVEEHEMLAHCAKSLFQLGLAFGLHAAFAEFSVW